MSAVSRSLPSWNAKWQSRWDSQAWDGSGRPNWDAARQRRTMATGNLWAIANWLVRRSAARFVLCLTLLDLWLRLSRVLAANLLAGGYSNERPFQPCLKRLRPKSSSVIPGPILAGMLVFDSTLSDEKDMSSRTIPPVEAQSTWPSANCGPRRVAERTPGENSARHPRAERWR